MTDYQLGILVASLVWGTLWVINHFRTHRAMLKAINQAEENIMIRFRDEDK